MICLVSGKEIGADVRIRECRAECGHWFMLASYRRKILVGESDTTDDQNSFGQ